MATSPQLVKTLSEVMGVPEKSITVQDRNLANAGLRTLAGRGRNAAKMTARDAATLAITVAAAIQIKESAEIAKIYTALKAECRHTSKSASKRSQRAKGTRWQLFGRHSNLLTNLPEDHCFVDALAALIEMVRSEQLNPLPVMSIEEQVADLTRRTKVIKDQEGTTELVTGSNKDLCQITVSVMYPMHHAQIEIVMDDTLTETMSYSGYRKPDPSTKEIKGKQDVSAETAFFHGLKLLPTGDLSKPGEFTARTIIALGLLLKT